MSCMTLDMQVRGTDALLACEKNEGPFTESFRRGEAEISISIVSK